jgi:hypothetical protein
MSKLLIPKDATDENIEVALVISQVPTDRIKDPNYFYSQFWRNRTRMDHDLEVRPEKWTWKKVYYSYKIYVSYVISNREPYIWDSEDEDEVDPDNPFLSYHIVPCTDLTPTEVKQTITDAKRVLGRKLKSLGVKYDCALDQVNKRFLIFMDIDRPFRGDFDCQLGLDLVNAHIKAFRKEAEKSYYVDFLETKYTGF